MQEIRSAIREERLAKLRKEWKFELS